MIQWCNLSSEEVADRCVGHQQNYLSCFTPLLAGSVDHDAEGEGPPSRVGWVGEEWVVIIGERGGGINRKLFSLFK